MGDVCDVMGSKKEQEINSTNTVITTQKNALACGQILEGFAEIKTVVIKMLDLWVIFFSKVFFNSFFTFKSRYLLGFPSGSVVKNQPASVEDADSIPGGQCPLEKAMAAHSSILAGKSHGQRSLVGYGPWDHRAGHDLVTKQQQISLETAAQPRTFSSEYCVPSQKGTSPSPIYLLS